MAYAPTFPRSKPRSFLRLLIVSGLVLLIALSAHAFIKHGSDALTVRNCMNQSGPILTMFAPDGRQACVCQVGENCYGVQIRKGDNEITAFIKNKMHKIEQVQRYLKNAGYKP